MTPGLHLRRGEPAWLEVATASGAPLWRYHYVPDTPAGESRRPYAHPVWSLAGDVLTNFRPNDHPWHHALSLTLTSVDGVNFWGGPSHRAADGYRWRDDHGVQEHTGWTSLDPARLEESLRWRRAPAGETLLEEHRSLETSLVDGGWSLRWRSRLTNVAGRPLRLDNYHSLGGLAGSHYTGLQFRGARDLLDEHGDATLGLTAEGGRAGEAAVHGAEAAWMEWSCQHDGSLRRTRIRFERPGVPTPWFVRTKNPVAAFAFHRETPQSLAPGEVLSLDHLLTFSPA